MTPKAVKLLLIGLIVGAMTAHALFLLIMRKPVLAHVVSSSLPDATRYSHRRMQGVNISNALALSKDEPTESFTLRIRYEVDGRYYYKDISTVVRKGDRPEPTQMLWYDPNNPSHATDRDISWIGLSLGFISLFAAAFDVI